MAVQWALSAFGPPGVLAAVAITAVVLVAGASGVFDQSEVNDDDYDDDGIYIPYVPPYVPNPNQNPEENGYQPEITVTPDQDSEKDKDKMQYALPFGYVMVYMSQPQGNDYDPDIDDLRPPKSSFTVGAEAYDSNIGFIIAAVMAGLLAYFVVRIMTEDRA